MKFLLLILSIMTWTVENKNAVTGEGMWPYDIEVSYSCTYQKGTVRANDEAVLSLGNLGGITVDKIDVYVKSNKTSGAGVFTVSANGAVIATKEGNLKEWTGDYDNESFHGVSLLAEAHHGVNSLDIKLVGKENSLYIDRFTIEYSNGPAHTVTLMKGKTKYSELTEEKGGQGVILPKMADINEWKFVGWCGFEFWTITTEVTLYYANTKFYPVEDCTLWAVYKYDNSPEMVYATDLVSGEYIYLNTFSNLAISGEPENGKLNTSYASVTDKNQQYLVSFNAKGDSATIQHIASKKYIGFSGTKIVETASKWQVFHEGDKTAFYMLLNGKTYILWPDILDMSGYCAGLLQTADVSQTTTALMTTKKVSEESIYTCHPESKLDVSHTSAEEQEYIFQFGLYELIIKNGHKELRIR